MAVQPGIGTEGLIRRAVRDMDPYVPVTSLEHLSDDLDMPIEALVKLDANENPYGTPAVVREAIAAYPHLHIYPDPSQVLMLQALSRYAGVDAELLIGGAGGDELIDLLARLVVEPGDRVIDCVPTFAMYAFFTQLCGGHAVPVERTESYEVDLEAVRRAMDGRTKAIFLASPNNPTGNVVARDDVLALLDLGVLVVVDEAYFEFSGKTVADLVPAYPRLVVLRTFSKWAGLAGLRVGYAICHPDVGRHLWKMKPPYNVSAAAQVAVCAAIDHLDEALAPVRAIVAERGRLSRGLETIGYLAPRPTEANFIFCPVRGRDASELRDRLRARGILIRYYDRPLLRNSLRVSVGTPAATDRLLAALRDL